MPGDQAARKLLGAWYTPAELVDIVVDGALDGVSPPAGRPIRVLDPACGDGRLLLAVARRLLAPPAGNTTRIELVGCDVDRAALAQLDALERFVAQAGAADRVVVRRLHDDALAREWHDEPFDLVVGNPPFLSQMATATTRGGASRHGGGPYAGAAVEFLALAVRLARPDGGRIALVLPQSILGARDAAPVRERVAAQADLRWSWWAHRQQHFDASVNVCVLGFERPATGATSPGSFARVVTDRLGVPALDIAALATDGVLGDRADLNANFRDEYYALVPAVADDADGPPLITSGLIDPGRCWWGERSVTFAKRTFERPRVDVSRLTGRFPAWAARKLVPKVLVANQTRIIEALADPTGSLLPGVPVNTVTPRLAPTPGGEPSPGATERAVWELAAVLTSPIASIHAWQLAAGTGLSTSTVRMAPALLAATPWPHGDLGPAVTALRTGDVVACARLVAVAYGLADDAAVPLLTWWTAQLPDRP